MDYQSLRARLLLEDRRVAEDVAVGQINLLRLLSYVAWSVAVVLTAAYAYRAPRYRAEALRVLVQRDLQAHIYATQIYLDSAEAIRSRILQLQPRLQEPGVPRQVLALDEERRQILDRAVAEVPVLQRAKYASDHVPPRLSGGVPWADPVSGVLLPEGVDHQKATDAFMETWQGGADQQNWLNAVASLMPRNDTND
jgi:hypothetical protein